jgi:HK97 family phage prohead protease
VKRWESTLDLTAPDVKKFDSVKDEAGNVMDYRDVRIRGYLSTFKETTESDRDGDYVERGAFKETLKRFNRNPVLLIDHLNSAENIAGSFEKIEEDDKGLYIEAVLSNSQSERMKDMRAKVAEGHLKALSMGGLFHYKEDGRGIFKVDLWEGSLVAVPANQDALFSTRALTAAEVKRLESERSP